MGKFVINKISAKEILMQDIILISFKEAIIAKKCLIAIHTGISVKKVPVGFKIRLSAAKQGFIEKTTDEGEIILYITHSTPVKYIRNDLVARLELVPDYRILEEES